VLPAAARMRQRAEFTATVRGRRAAAPALVVHYRAEGDDAPARVGFIVSSSVGGAVVRNGVRRRLRHLMRDRLAELPRGSRIVVRANRAAAGADSADLAVALDAALRRATADGRSR
jgi:ribonuclease P protein component